MMINDKIIHKNALSGIALCGLIFSFLSVVYFRPNMESINNIVEKIPLKCSVIIILSRALIAEFGKRMNIKEDLKEVLSGMFNRLTVAKPKESC